MLLPVGWWFPRFSLHFPELNFIHMKHYEISNEYITVSPERHVVSKY